MPEAFVRTNFPAVSRVRIKDYKSIGLCDVSLKMVTLLVGRNGAGKSNFLDALNFVADALRTTLDHAIRDRGGVDAVRRKSKGHPRNIAIELELRPTEDQFARYGFEIAAKSPNSFEVKQERLDLYRPGVSDRIAGFVRRGLKFADATEKMPAVLPDRLAMVTASGFELFRPTYDLLTSMGFYNLNPESMKDVRAPDPDEVLRPDGANIASVIGRLKDREPQTIERINEYLSRIVPDVTGVNRRSLGPKETLEFHQRVRGDENPRSFYASSMSDGTLRALGALVAVKQLDAPNGHVRLVGIEEPETALHPGAAGTLMDALKEGSARTQVLVTTHGVDLLDEADISTDELLVVVSRNGTTEIAPVDQASRTAIRDHLYRTGELLRMDQLEPDEADLRRQRQTVLFETKRPA
ncbi:MAG: AAA family ATPase [Planctomycetota bacterium JB042]